MIKKSKIFQICDIETSKKRPHKRFASSHEDFGLPFDATLLLGKNVRRKSV